LACVIAETAFAQEEPDDSPPMEREAALKILKNAVVLDLFQLFKGFIATDSETDFTVFILSTAYEQLLTPHFNIGEDLE
jgi:hypothetical protein